nr:zinc finger BED domain-containing protein RICESLEEPER 2 [Tanacetum cinerariifolium]
MTTQSQSTSTSVGVGSSNETTIVEVIETTRNKDNWQHYDLCKISDGSMKDRCKRCDKKVKRSRSDNTGTNEFGRYTETDWIISMEQEEFNNFDILSWWKVRQSQFPVLSIMARDLLSIQASRVASESTFSLSGRVLSIRRTRLTLASLKMCIFLKDHLDAQERIQHTSNLEGDCLEIEQQLCEVEAEAGYAINISDEEIYLEEQAMSGSGFDDSK